MDWEENKQQIVQLQENKQIYLYGAGKNGKEILFVLKKMRMWLPWDICFLDQDIKKQMQGVEEYSVMDPKIFFVQQPTDCFVVVTPDGLAGQEIMEMLNQNLNENIPIFYGFDFLHTVLSLYCFLVHDIVFFASESLLPTTVCNLNCRDCLNFTPYIQHHYIESFYDLQRDIDVFFSAVDLVYRFQITGGEPLLYQYLEDLIVYISQTYGKQILRLEMVTNGTILPSDTICRLLHRYKVHVFLDDYRESLPNYAVCYETIRKKFIEFGVDFEENLVSQWIQMYDPNQVYVSFTEEQLCDKFRLCKNPWSSLRNGKIASCNYAMYAAKAGICADTDTEYYDLTQYSSKKKRELVAFRLRNFPKGYTEFCKICNGWTMTNQKWCEPAIQAERKKTNEVE